MDPGRILLAFVLIAVGVWSYSTSFTGAFIGDDVEGIAQNPSIRSVWPLTVPLSPPKDTTLAGRPVANLTFAINYALAPAGARDLTDPDPTGRADDPFLNSVWGYHAVNLVVHLLAGLVLFGVVRRTLLAPPLRDRFGRASTSLAFCISLIWLAHPLNTQAVTFLVQRVESLMGLFYLTTLYCAIRAAETDFQSRAWTAGAIVACALGMATKEVMVSAPIVVALWIWVCRPDVRLFGKPLRLFVGLAATWIIVIALAATAARTKSVGFGVDGWSALLYLRTQAGVIVHYLRLAFWPNPLVFQYAWLPAGSWGQVLPQIALLGSLGAATAYALIRRLPIGLLGAAFFLILAPSSSILPVATEVAAEHRMYLPLAAVVATIVLGAYALWHRFASGASLPRSRRQPRAIAAWIVVAAIVAPLAWTTHARSEVYKSGDAMTADLVVSRPQNAQAQISHATHFLRSRQYAEAEKHLRIALGLPLTLGADERTLRSLMHMHLGSALNGQRKFDEGIKELKQALDLRPDLDMATGLIAEAELGQGRARNALVYLDRAIARRPDVPILLARAAWVLSTSSDASIRNGAKAVEYAEKAVTLTNADDVIMLDTLAAAYAEAGQFEKAVTTVRAAITLATSKGKTDMMPTLQGHLGLFQARHPMRTAEW